MNPQENLRLAVNALRVEFGALNCSKVYESEAVGFKGDNFLNLAVTIETNRCLRELQDYLKKLETLFCLDRNIVLGVPSVQDRCAGCYSDGEGVCAKLCAFKLDVAIKRRDHNDLAFCILDSPNWFWFSLSFIFRPYHTQFQTLLA